MWSTLDVRRCLFNDEMRQMVGTALAAGFWTPATGGRSSLLSCWASTPTSSACRKWTKRHSRCTSAHT